MREHNKLLAQALAFEIAKGGKQKENKDPDFSEAPLNILIKPNRPARKSRLKDLKILDEMVTEFNSR